MSRSKKDRQALHTQCKTINSIFLFVLLLWLLCLLLAGLFDVERINDFLSSVFFIVQSGRMLRAASLLALLHIYVHHLIIPFLVGFVILLYFLHFVLQKFSRFGHLMHYVYAI